MKTLYERTVSAIPVSIGTSLALESIFYGTQEPYDKERQPPERIDLSQYQEAWFNLETIIRNIQGASDRVTFIDSPAQHIAEIVLTEIDIIQSVFQVEGSNICRPVFFSASYKSLRGEYKGRARFRESQTVIQKAYDLKVTQILKHLSKLSDKILDFDSDLKPTKNPQGRPSVFIVTHYPADLLSAHHFQKLDLLESHTGVLKKPYQWNTKYAPFGQESLSHLPFHKSLLMIFGDRSMIEALEPKLRKKILEISIKDGWTPHTRMDRIRESYRNNIDHPADLAFVNGF